jgi:hypothetical protein
LGTNRGVSDIEATIAAMVAERGTGKTICPSEVARALAGGEDFRPLMPDVREAAAALADRGEVVVTQRGEPVDARTARGPIRLGRPPR